MGIFRAKSKPGPEVDAPLAPVHPPVKLFAGCTLAQPTTLVMRSKIAWLKDDPSMITDPGGSPVLGIAGNGWAWKEVKRVSTPDGRPLFTLNNKHKSKRRAFTLDDGATQYARIEQPNSAVKLTLVARLAGTVGDARTLKLVGSNSMDAATVTLDTGQVAAQISYSCWKEVLKNKHTYTAHVAPGVDIGLVTALMLAWDTSKTELGAIAAS